MASPPHKTKLYFKRIMSGIKITYAIDSNGLAITADAFNKNHYPLKCPDPRCSAQLEHVTGYKRESYGKQQFIPDFFRLEKGFDHDDQCKYKSIGLNSLLVNDSTAEVQLALLRGEQTFRIHLMDNHEQAILKNKQATFQANPPSDTTKRRYRKKGNIAPYVRNIDSLFEIYKFGVQNPNLRQVIEIVVGKQKMLWADFFFSTHHLGTLLNKIRKDGVVQAALIITSNMISFPSARHNQFCFIEFFPKRFVLGPAIFPVVKLSKSINTNAFTPQTRYLVFGRFDVPSPMERFTNIISGTEIRTIVSSMNQIYEF